MADNGNDIDETEDTGGFAFGEERTTDEESDVGDKFTDGAIVVAVILAAIVIVAIAAAAVVQPFGGKPDNTENKAPGASAGTTTVGTGGTEIETVGGPTSTDSATTPWRTSTSSPLPSATATSTLAATPTENDSQTDGDGAENRTATDERSPVIESFTVTDRSSGGAAIFDVAWNVTDPTNDLVAVRVSLVTDPNGEAKIIERRRFDADGAQSADNTTFEIPNGGGEVYELRIEVVDGSGNTVFSLTRAVADGSTDE